MDLEKLQVMKDARGFIAALDQSGGSSAKTLSAYGIAPESYSTEDEMFLSSILNKKKYIFYLMVCDETMSTLECMLVLRKLGYAHWNQYYFDNMELDKLNGLVKKAIKELAVDEKLEQMNEDFAETKIIETPLTTPKYITILE